MCDGLLARCKQLGRWGCGQHVQGKFHVAQTGCHFVFWNACQNAAEMSHLDFEQTRGWIGSNRDECIDLIATGFSLGSLAGLMADLSHAGVNIDFVDEVSTALLPGKTAVLAEVEESWETPVDTRIGNLGGLVVRRGCADVVEDQLLRESVAFQAELQQLEDVAP